jgi:superfamily II RNA helicase
VLEQALRLMVEKEMFPAVCFLLSKKQIETISKKITVDLLEFDSKVPYTIQKECENILRQKFSNYKNFLHLPEFFSLLKLLEKGIAIHHSGMIPVLRELVEILFERGFIKLLFATETFSVGLNMPIKTSIFTDIFKFDGNGRRMFFPHEFTQASGRAGRRGLDEEGFVIHLFNLYDSHQKTDFRLLLNGPSQKLVSKFKMSFHLFFSNENINSFCSASLTNFETRGNISSMLKEQDEISQVIQKEQAKILKTPNEVLQEYVSLSRYKSQKQQKKNKLKQDNLKEDYPALEDDLKSKKKLETLIQRKETMETKKCTEIQKLDEKIHSIKKFLTEQGCFDEKGDKTILGNIASKIHHVPCLGLGQKTTDIANLEINDLICLLGCFIPITVPESLKTHVFPQGKTFYSILKDIDTIYHTCYDFEVQNGIYTGEDYTIQFNFIDFLDKWANVTTEEEANILFEKMKNEKGIFLGEFVKYIMNLNNLSRELENVAEFVGDVQFLSKLKQIPDKTVKFIVTNQSLYV